MVTTRRAAARQHLSESPSIGTTTTTRASSTPGRKPTTAEPSATRALAATATAISVGVAGARSPSATATADEKTAPPSASSTLPTTTTATTATNAAMALLLFEHLPPWRQDNTYILTSYRAESGSYVGSLGSIASHLHNESVNIWTHLAGAVVFPLYGVWLWQVVYPRYDSADADDVAVFACFFAGALVCLALSAACHTLMNHSAEVSRWGSKLDYAGIVCLIVGSYMPALYYGFYCDGALMLRYMMLVSHGP